MALDFLFIDAHVSTHVGTLVALIIFPVRSERIRQEVKEYNEKVEGTGSGLTQ